MDDVPEVKPPSTEDRLKPAPPPPTPPKAPEPAPRDPFPFDPRAETMF